MLVRDILNLKGGTIYSIEPSGRVTSAVELMVRYDVGSLVVIDAGTMVGMLSFREVLQALQRGGGSLAETEAREIMVTEPVCGSPDQTIDELSELMKRHRIRYLPVCDGDKLLGVVSFHDVAQAVIKETSMQNRLLKRYIESQPSEQNP